jgi:hypothetical protein
MSDINDASEEVAQPVAPGLAALQFQGPYQALYQQMQQQAQQKQKAQQEYLGSLQKQEAALGQQGMSDYDRASMLFQAAGALGQPTRSGGLGETLGNLGTAMSGPLSKAAEAQRTRAQQLQQLQMARQKLGMEMAGTGGVDPGQALQLLKAQQDQEEEPETFKRDEVNGRPVLVGSRGTVRPFDYKAAGIDATAPAAPRGVPQEVMDLGPRAVEEYVSSRAKEVAKEQAAVREQSSTVDPESRKKITAASGIPMPEIDMMANITNPKDRERAKLVEMNRSAAFLNDEEKKKPTSALQQEVEAATRFLELNNANQSKTGPGVGMLPSISSAAREMDKIGIVLSRGMRTPGEGSMSDFDAKQFAKATLSTSNDYKTNSNIGTAYIAAKQLEQDRREYFRDYLAQNQTLNGAQKHWNKYLSDNPIFDKSGGVKEKPDLVKLNPSRLGYQDYFRQQASPGSFVRDENGRLVLQQGQQR